MQGPMTTVLTQSLLPAGTHYTAPLPITVAANGITSRGLLTDSDGGDATKKLAWAFEYSFDGVTFDPSRSPNEWQGGALPKGATAGPPWQLPAGFESWSSSQVPAVSVRVRLELPQPLSVGWQLQN